MWGAMADFSDEDIEPWEDEETCVANQPSLPTDLDDDDTSNIKLGSYDYAILHKIPPKAVPHDPDDEFSMDYWRNFRDLMNKAVTLDDMQLIVSDYPELVKACIFRNRWILLVKKEREDLCDTDLYDSDKGEVVEFSEEYFRYKLEEYWNYHDEESGKLINNVTEGCLELIAYTGEGGCHDLTMELVIEDEMDVESGPDARANFELSTTMMDSVDVHSDPDARAKLAGSSTLEDGVDVLSEADARARFKFIPTMEDRVDVCSGPDTRARYAVPLETDRENKCKVQRRELDDDDRGPRSVP